MSTGQFQHVEQDKEGGDELPTYDTLVAQSAPNSRFGRWRGWVEKRAGERFLDITSEERARRRDLGWGNESEQLEISVQSTSTHTQPLNLHVSTDFTQTGPPNYPSGLPGPDPPPLTPLPFTGKCLSPAHLTLHNFGSRFLPHTTSPIRCLLPLHTDQLLLIGHDDGLSVLDNFPSEWMESGSIDRKGPSDAKAFLVWRGEGVFQMSMLEVESTAQGDHQGVVLALVGPESNDCSPRDQEPPRTVRMYNLASLTSLAKAAISHQGAQPVDLRSPSIFNSQQSTFKKHRSQASITIARGLKSLIESPIAQRPEPLTSYPSLVPTPDLSGRTTPTRKDSVRSFADSTWDFVDDAPLRWATDFVPLAAAGSRLNTSVISFALWRDDVAIGKGSVILAVLTKLNIFLYEAPKGERAFRFIKEFYTPVQARSVTFVQQAVQDVTRSVSDAGRSGHNRSNSNTAFLRREATLKQTSISYTPQLSMFVIFEKKAGCIRIADSAVTEVELYDDSSLYPRDSSSSPGTRRIRTSGDGFSRDSKPVWVSPTRIELPVIPSSTNRATSRTVHILTRGRKTHILPSPLPSNITSIPPLCIFSWDSIPTYVAPRICRASEASGSQPFLQLVAFGADGVEVQETSLSFLSKCKGKARPQEVLRSQVDVGDTCGFLCPGGHWHRPGYPQSITRSFSVASNFSGTSFDSLESTDITLKLQQEQGIYGWCRKGLADWRIFWVGGDGGGDGSDKGKGKDVP